MPNAIDTLRELLASEPGEDARSSVSADWCVDCGEWVAEHGPKVEALLQAAEKVAGSNWYSYPALAAAVRRVIGESA